MGGLGPGIGGLEYVVIGIVALVVVGPERLPGMLRALGKMVAKARGMANEFRASFEDMARQSELDELRKEVDALRTGQMVPLGAAADEAFKDIKAELDKPAYVETPPNAVILDQPEFPEPVVAPPEAEPKPVPKTPRKPRASATRAAADGTTTKTPSAKTKAQAAKPRAPRKPKATV
ncbi:twin arginine-targeting protein translocase TatB [Brevundimonas sp. LM2]|uniref:Sec-independent protein translocase protein TatB n=1 Tax=Brevundimonas sp. LM2 TaxID=1938605 RepID=UPI000983E286|nr:Sec-independent protein translocase protein TatB [Brevundimonas sp. LM2]AQR62205.1 twin arginine-targeting protein translocase TatB [Brevundimonas sp. LM2]